VRISDQTLNRLTMLKAILRGGPLARSELPALTGLSAGLVTQLTNDLVARGILEERREAGSRVGRPRMLLRLARDGGVVVGASIDGMGHVDATFVNLAGERLHVDREAMVQQHSLPDVALDLARALGCILDRAPVPRARIDRLGMALPALIDSARGEVHFNATFPAVPTPFAAPLSARLGVPVTIENDMDCMARAEHWFGRARDDAEFLLLRIGLSVDAAAFADGVPKPGGSGLSSSFGHTKLEAAGAGRPCFCGGYGCLATQASAYGILSGAGRLDDLPFPSVDALPERFAALLAEAREPGSAAAGLIAGAGRALGTAVGNLLNIAGPASLYIAFDDLAFASMARPAFDQALAAAAMPGVLPRTRIRFITTAEDWRWRGTAAMALEALYLDNDRRRAPRRRPAPVGSEMAPL
jgi:predicted NBD/HSP70 family sugar kinase